METLAMALADALFAALPRRRPSPDALQQARIVAHRGAHEATRGVAENTLAAFAAARDAGVWGIETDIRWTRDHEPVLVHDPDTARVFGKPLRVAEVRAAQLRSHVPGVPTLAEVVQRYAPGMHLMLEIKDGFRPEPQRQQQRLLERLAPLRPVHDYHLMALDPALFSPFTDIPAAAMIPIARFDVARMSALALERGYAGIAGHYALIGKRYLRRHQRRSQAIGVGFPTSRNGLYRELNRGVDWIFSDHAVKLQHYVQTALETRP